MKPFIRFLAPACAAALASEAAGQTASCTGPESDVKLYVDVEGVRSSDGLVAVTLYADKASKFLRKRGSLYVGRVAARAGTTSVCIHLPSAGIYALAVYHDADADRGFDRTGVGLPDEGFGFSNNPRVFLGMPAWSSVRLSVPRTDLRTRIRLRYP
ncbi:MAG TPA: DUF2141 domain-containing protein [Croceibacterium sp.]|nr:DUF2141 domain-containing protein [Croceibacterium sp.]